MNWQEALSRLDRPIRLPENAKAKPREHGVEIVKFCGLSLKTAAPLAALLARILPESERLRTSRFLHAADRDRFMLGRSFLRLLSANYLQTEPGKIVFETSQNGRPFLADCDLDFNVSHSGDCVLIVWSVGLRVGADVEAQTETALPFHELAETSFSKEEREVLAHAAEGEKAETFYRIWVHKEAVVKAEGAGLGGPLQDFSMVRLEAGRAVWADEVVYPDSRRGWRLVDLEAPRGHFAALAVPPEADVEEGFNFLLNLRG